MKLYRIETETLEINFCTKFETLKRNFEKAFDGDRDEETVKDFENKEEAIAAFAEIVKENPRSIAIVEGYNCSLVNVKTWQLREVLLDEDGDETDNDNPCAMLDVYDNFPTEEQFLAWRDGEPAEEQK